MQKQVIWIRLNDKNRALPEQARLDAQTSMCETFLHHAYDFLQKPTLETMEKTMRTLYEEDMSKFFEMTCETAQLQSVEAVSAAPRIVNPALVFSSAFSSPAGGVKPEPEEKGPAVLPGGLPLPSSAVIPAPASV
ncbi:hypothetical protein BH10PSE19_BH10PSE19_06060 [soil metagenome]